MSGTKTILGDNFESGGGSQTVVKDNAMLIQTKEVHLHQDAPEPPVIPRQLPFLEVCFLHREQEISWLLNELHPGRVVAVCGPGGMGKSALAAQAVSKLEESRFPDGVVFHNFYSEPHTDQALQTICNAFQVKAKTGLESTVRQTLSGKKALLILDGTEEAEDLYAVLRLRGQCGVLITSRKNEDAPDEPLELKRLEEQQAKEVFQRYSGLAINDASVRGICKILDGWPVALRIAGRYLRSRKESAADYLQWLEKEPFKELGSGKHQEENASLLLRRSIAQVNDDARIALGVAGSLAFEPIAREPVAAILEGNERRARKALGELVNYGLLETKEERWQVNHALVHTYACKELALSKESLGRLTGWYIDFCETQSEAGLEGYACLDAERAHCLRLLESCLDNRLCQEVKTLAIAIQDYLDRQGYWTEDMAVTSIRLIAARQRGDSKEEGECLNDLGYIYNRRGEYSRALVYLDQSLAIHQSLGDQKEQGTTLNNIAFSYEHQGNYEMALQQYQQSLTMRKEAGDRKGESRTLSNIGKLYKIKGDFKTALKYLEQDLVLTREEGDVAWEGVTLGYIGQVYYAKSDTTKALKYYKHALSILQKVGDKIGEAEMCWNIGLAYKDMSNLEQTEEYISQAVQIAEQIDLPLLQQWRDGLARVRAARQGTQKA